jgi:hypothetical protein
MPILCTIVLSALLNQDWTISLLITLALPVLLCPGQLFFPAALVALLAADCRRQQLVAFSLQKKLARLEGEKEKIARAVQTLEMRHIIANVAHDLKTVSPCPMPHPLLTSLPPLPFSLVR